MNTLNGIQAEKVSLEDAVSYCYTNRDRFLHEFDSIDEGIEQFDCLIEILDGTTINPVDLGDYGMNDQELSLDSRI